MKLLKCLCSSATCAQTAQLLSQQVRQARAPSEMRATALASAGGSAAVAVPVSVAAGPQMTRRAWYMSFSAGWCLQAPLLWPCRSMRQHTPAREAPQHRTASSQQLHAHAMLRARCFAPPWGATWPMELALGRAQPHGHRGTAGHGSAQRNRAHMAPLLVARKMPHMSSQSRKFGGFDGLMLFCLRNSRRSYQ